MATMGMMRAFQMAQPKPEDGQKMDGSMPLQQAMGGPSQSNMGQLSGMDYSQPASSFFGLDPALLGGESRAGGAAGASGATKLLPLAAAI